MTDPNLPPERPLDDATRARLRAELSEYAATHREPDGRSGRVRPWLLPGLAAASVAAVALAGGLALGAGTESDEPADLPRAAASSTPSTSAPSNEADEELLRCIALADQHADGTSAAGWQAGTRTQAATLVLHQADGESHDNWAVCSEWAAESFEGPVTVLGARGTDEERSATTFAPATQSSADGGAVQFVAAGTLLDPAMEDVASIRYAFPDGEQIDALIEDDLWVMHHRSAVPADDPIVVTVTLDDGSTETWDLE